MAHEHDRPPWRRLIDGLTTGGSAGAATRASSTPFGTSLDQLLGELARTPPGALPDQDDVPFAGTSRFQVLRRLGAGGFGVVYLVRDLAAGADVALKALAAPRPELIYRLKREFRTLADLRHENLVSFYELFASEDRCFFTMEYVPGSSFLEHVRPRGALDEARLREALRQLARGLGALHQAGKVHRDVKPSNVLVSTEGRVVLLDFGLATEIDETGSNRSLLLGGTPEYMSPEHAGRGPLTAASDWYSVGAMLYEALSGALPFPAARAVAGRGAAWPPDPPPAEPLAAAPRDLAELCLRLLAPEPERRPAGADVASSLGPAAPRTGAARAAAETKLVGRDLELDALRDALEAARAGGGVTALVEGASGAGKTALVGAFLAEQEREGDAVVLRGRCYERERVPYQGIDSLVDDLCRFMQRRDRPAVDALLPRHVAALVRLFPVLGRVPGVVERCRAARAPGADEQEVRHRAFGALRELFGRISDRHPLVVHIDDLQWGDLDTAALLHELLRPPDAPAMLVVLSYREEDRAKSPCLAALAAASMGEVVRVRVGALDAAAAAELARRSLGARREHAARVAAEAGGNPFFILELARFASAREWPSALPLELDAALLARIAELPDAAHRLLEVVAVAGHPIAESVARRAADLPGAPWQAWGALVTGHLVRFVGPPDARQVEPFHDRIRECVAASVPAPRCEAWHRGLALALEASGDADPEVLARHHAAAGDLARAHDAAVRAAAQSEHALAFDRAARLFRWAIELAPPGADRAPLLASLAAALAHAGRGVESAQAYLTAADLAEPRRRTALRREAALQLLQSGRIDEGREVAREVLSSLGLTTPPTPRRALAALLLQRGAVRLRGLRFHEVTEADAAPESIERIDHLWALSRGFAMVDVVRGAEYSARHLRLALACGEPRRVAQGLASAASHLATSAPGARRTRALLDRLDGLDLRLGDPSVHAYARLARAVHAQSLGAWRSALALADEAERAFAERCTGVAWEIWTARLFGISSLFYLGRYGELDRRVEANLAEAADRGNVYALAAMRAPYGAIAWLARGDPAGARRHVADAVASWSVQGFQLQHYWLLMAETFLDLHAGDGAAALARLRARWRDLGRSLLPRLPFVRSEVLHARAASAAAAALAEADPDARRTLQGQARRSARALDRVGSRFARSLSRLVSAAVDAQEGRAAEAADALTLAAAEFDLQSMEGHAGAARARLAALRGGPPPAGALVPGERLADDAAFVRMLAPGFPD